MDTKIKFPLPSIERFIVTRRPALVAVTLTMFMSPAFAAPTLDANVQRPRAETPVLLAQAYTINSPEYRRGYIDGQRGMYNSDRDGEEYKAGYRAGDTARTSASESFDYRRGYTDGQRGRYNSDRDTEEYKSGYRAGEGSRAQPQAGQGSPDYRRGYADGQRGLYNSDRDTEEYKSGQRAGEAARRGQVVGPAGGLPEAAFYACTERAERGPRSNVRVTGYQSIGTNVWEVYMAIGGRQAVCIVESRGIVHTFTE